MHMKKVEKLHKFRIHSVAGLLPVLLISGLAACFDSSTERAPPSLHTQPVAGPVPPVVVDDTLSVPVGVLGIVEVLSNDTASDGGALVIDTYDTVGAQGGTIVYNGDGSFSYMPPMSYEGLDQFSYTVADAAGTKAVGKVLVTVSSMVIPNGKAYYAGNCAVCHAAGMDDASSAFHASNLALRANALYRDLSVYGGEFQLMGAYYAVSQQNIDELKAYLATLAP